MAPGHQTDFVPDGEPTRIDHKPLSEGTEGNLGRFGRSLEARERTTITQEGTAPRDFAQSDVAKIDAPNKPGPAHGGTA